MESYRSLEVGFQSASKMGITKPEIISRETIKPSSPTQHSKRIYKISVIDQLSSGFDVAIIIFYQNKEGNNNINNNNNNNSVISSGLIKKSLSETLTHYYPLAGRMKNGATVECNDEGAYFTEARVDSHLEEFLKHHHDPDLDLFMPDKRWEAGSLLNLQITCFSCGGIAIGIRMCHVLADIAAASAFINDWTTMARQLSCKEVSVSVSVSDSVSAELTQFFPPPSPPPYSLPIPEAVLPFKGNLVRRKFTFDSTKLGKLKLKATQSGVKNPTRVQLVTALIYRCAVIAASKVTSTGFLKPSVLTQVVNLRKRIIPPLPEKSFGNIVWVYNIQTAKESEMEFPTLVGQLKAGLSHFCDTINGKKNITGQELIEVLFMQEADTHSDRHVDKYTFTSWCRSSLYEADFGWGKPIWLSPAGIPTKNVICLNDTREGNGIEAFVALEERDMAMFQRDEELLQFCYLH